MSKNKNSQVTGFFYKYSLLKGSEEIKYDLQNNGRKSRSSFFIERDEFEQILKRPCHKIFEGPITGCLWKFRIL